MTAPDFSVIMPSYARQEFLNEAVQSVLEQSHADWELIVVDDASPAPLEVVEDPRVHLVRQERNGGFSEAANTGLALAQGTFVAFLADDDVWAPHRLRHALMGHERADVVWCDSVVLGSDVAEQSEPPRVEEIGVGPLDRELPESMCAVSVRRALCPPLNPEFRGSEDLEWAIRLRRSPLVEARVTSPDFLWRRHDGPRNLNGPGVRITASQRLLGMHADFYRQNPRARAFRLVRIGIMQHSLGQSGAAMRTAVVSSFVRPSQLAIALLLRAGAASLRNLFTRPRP